MGPKSTPGNLIQSKAMETLAQEQSSSTFTNNGASKSKKTTGNLTTDDEEEDEEEEENAQSLKTLIKSKFQGKLSKFEELRRQEISDRKKKRKADELIAEKLEAKQEEVERQKEVEKSEVKHTKEQKPPEIKSSGPRIRIVNGEMIIDESSLVVETPSALEDGDLQRVEEGALRYVSAASFRTRSTASRVRWTDPMTNRFYEGLSYFGTDFGLISLLFPGMTRQQIKLKFNSEERANPSRVNASLLNRKVPDETVKNRMKGWLQKKQERSKTVTTTVPVPEADSNQKPSSSLLDGRPASTELEPSAQLASDHQEDEAIETPEKTREETAVERKLQEQNEQAVAQAVESVYLNTTSRPITKSTKPKVGPKVGPSARPRKPKTTQPQEPPSV